jgi:hypothetical protein
MAKRKIEDKSTSTPKVAKSILPIGKEVPKEGFEIDPAKIPTLQTKVVNAKMHKEDGPVGKIGPKADLVKGKVYPKVELQIPKIEVNKKK